MKIYTKTGDTGETALYGGERRPKDDMRIRAIGSVDELNSQLGLVLVELQHEGTAIALQQIQQHLFLVGNVLASPRLEVKAITENEIQFLEDNIDSYDDQLPTMKRFILPGGSKSGALLHVARSVCRRAERTVVALSKIETIDGNVLVYLNRLADLLFVLARFINQEAGVAEVEAEN